MKISPFTLIATLASSSLSNFASADVKRTLRGTDVYGIAPSQLLESELEAFSISPAVEPPVRKLPVPSELSDDPEDPAWVLEGYLVHTRTEDLPALTAKRDKVRAYYDELSEEDRIELERRLETRRTSRKREAALARGESFDERKEVAVAMLEDGTVWSLRSTSSVDSLYALVGTDAEEFVGNGTVAAVVETVEERPNSALRSREGQDLELISRHNGYNMRSFPWRAQGCLSSTSSSAGCRCSGTKISARLVITAGHCLTEGPSFDPRARYWLPGADGVDRTINGRDDTPNGVRGSVNQIVPPQWFYDENPAYDWGLFVLTASRSNCDLGWFGYSNLARPTGTGVNVFGYPAYDCENSPLASGICSDSLYGDFDTIGSATSQRIRYSIDTQGGMSGSGVYVLQDDQRLVVGVHAYGAGTDGIATKVNNDVLSTIKSIRERYPDSSAC